MVSQTTKSVFTLLVLALVGSASSQATGNFPSFAADLASWPARWNNSDCRDAISVPATCAELTDGFQIEGEAPDQYVHAQNHQNTEGIHGGCGADGELVHGPDQDCGQAVFRFFCHDEATVRFSAEGMPGSGGRFRGNDDSFWAWQDEQLNFMHLSGPFRQFGEWRISGLGNGFHARAGAHTVVLSEREDGARIRSLAMTVGYPTCHFGAPDADRTAIPGLERQIETVTSTLTAADASLSNDISQVESTMTEAISTLRQELTAGASTAASTAMVASMTAASQLSTAQSQIVELQTLVASVTAKLSQSVPAFDAGAAPPRTVATTPSVESFGTDLFIRAPAGDVKIAGSTCGTVDVCDLGRQIEAITSQINSPV